MPTKVFFFANGKIKIGVIGLTTLETVAKTAGFNKDRFDILDYKAVVESASAQLRKQGCQAVLILSHVGTNCKKPSISKEDLKDLYELKLRDKSYQAADKCDGEMADLLKVLNKDAVDGVVAGHIHEAVHHFFNEIPVIQNPMSNVFTNLLYLKFTKNSKGEYAFIRKESKIEGPIPLCNLVYSNNKRCNEFQQLSSDVYLQEFLFHGSKLIPDYKVEDLFEKKYANLNKEIEEYKKQVVFTTEYRLERDVKKENVLGNLVTDILRKVTDSDIAFDTPGSLRYVWDIGIVSKYELNNMFPFGGNYGQIKLKGNVVIEIIKRLQTAGEMGYIYAFSGIKMKLIKDKNGKKTLDLKSLVLNDGTPLDPNTEYKIGSSTFLLGGGDDMKSLKDENIIGSQQITNKVPILTSVEQELKNIRVFSKANSENYLGRITVEDVKKKKMRK